MPRLKGGFCNMKTTAHLGISNMSMIDIHLSSAINVEGM